MSDLTVRRNSRPRDCQAHESPAWTERLLGGPDHLMRAVDVLQRGAHDDRIKAAGPHVGVRQSAGQIVLFDTAYLAK